MDISTLRHDTQHNDTQHNDSEHNDTQKKGLICDPLSISDTQLKMTLSMNDTQHE